MERVQFIKNIGELERNQERRAFFSALVSCLTPNEACELFFWALQNGGSKRAIVIQKIIDDMELQLQSCHVSIIQTLIREVKNDIPYNRKQTYAYCLSCFAIVSLPENLQQDILQAFFKSQYKAFRNRAYKLLQSKWNEKFLGLIEEMWLKHHDHGCAKLIIEHSSIDFLKEHIDGVLEAIKESQYLVKELFLHVGNHDVPFLQKLASVDPITYFYCMTKIGKVISHDEARAIFETGKSDERVGLILWCIGQQKLWDVLIEIQDDIDRIPDYKMQRYLETIES